MKVLITGNMGYVGPRLVEHLRNVFPDATLIGLDTGFFGHCLTAPEELPEARLDMQVFADVRHVGPEVLDGVDVLIELAAISNDPMGNLYEQVTAEVNQEACVRLARLAKENGVGHVVFASSCSVYGFAEGGPRAEDAALNPLTAYARSKIGTEKAIAGLASEDFVITCLRFPTACGWSPRLRLDLVLNDFVASAIATGKVEVLSDGTPWRPLIDVGDMARAMEWAMQREAGQGGAFLAINVGHKGCNYQVRELAETVQKVVGGVEVSINTNAQPDKRSYQVAFDLYERLAPGHLPQVSLEQSIRELHAGLTRMGFSDPRFRESQYIRLRVLAGLRERGLIDEQLAWVKAA